MDIKKALAWLEQNAAPEHRQNTTRIVNELAHHLNWLFHNLDMLIDERDALLVEFKRNVKPDVEVHSDIVRKLLEQKHD